MTPQGTCRYEQLINAAEGHKEQGAEAAAQIQELVSKYKSQMAEASVHRSRHAELWHEAEM